MYRRILVPVDGSRCSTRALKHALALAKALGADVTLLHAYEDPFALWANPESVPYRLGLYQDYERMGREILAQAKSLADAAGVEALTCLVKNRHPTDAIREAGEKNDLIVMGSHGRRGVDRIVMGSVTDGVLHSSNQPLLVVHAAEPERGQAEATEGTARLVGGS